MSLIAIIKHI